MTQNTEATIKRRRGPGKPWVKGQSGNPGGRPCLPAELKALAQAKAADAIKIAVQLMESAESEQVRLAAANVIMDRGYGKPAQHVDADVRTDDVTNLSPSEIAARIEAFEAKRKG